MNHSDHVHLIQKGIPQAGDKWADFGSGTGAFTLALADLLGAGGEIYSVDRDRSALDRQERTMRTRFPQVRVYYLAADFTQPLDLPPLDGIVMANALHYVPDRRKVEVLRNMRAYLRPGGRLVMVEYNVDRGNIWVPHPFSFTTWQSIASQAGFGHTSLLATAPSSFLKEFYSAESE